MAAQTPSGLPLTAGAEALIANALQQSRENRARELALYHWLLALLERNGAMAASLVQNLDVRAVAEQAKNRVQSGDAGESLSEATLLEAASNVARERGKSQVAERDLAIVILRNAGYDVQIAAEIWKAPARPPSPIPEGQTSESPAPRPGNSAPASPSNTPILDRFGRDLTRAARDGKLTPVLHRDKEIAIVLETLCRRTKRNPALVGPAGVGKTAIVEGIAQRIADGKVPRLLRDVRLIGIQPSSLVAGSGVVGELETRVKGLIAEASQPGIVLFIDEIHSMMGAGGMRGATDMASLLKPVLARGEIACIGATTDDEYRRFIEEDKALERRFNRINIDELNGEQTLGILRELSIIFMQERQVGIDEDVLPQLVAFASRYMRNRYFPDKAVDLLEQCVARAVATGAATVDHHIALEVSEGVTGMPVDVETCIPNLRARLAGGWMRPEDAATLSDRLEVTVRGLDMVSPRPNAVILLAGQAASRAEEIAPTIAGCLFGSPSRVVIIDFARFVHETDISALLGATPGYVGYEDALPIHAVAQTPWCVLVCHNVDLCHPSVRGVLRQALASGYFTDGKGKRIYLSDSIVILTVCQTEQLKGRVGFQPLLNTGNAPESGTAPGNERLVQALGEGLFAQVDLVISELSERSEGLRDSLQELLAGVSARFAQHHLVVAWHDTAVKYILERGQANWERFVDGSISPQLVRFLPGGGGKEKVIVTVAVEGDRIKIEQAS